MLTLVGMYTRRLGRREGDPTPRRNDWAIGTTLLFMTFGIVVSDIRLAEAGTDVSPAIGWLLVLVLALLMSVDVDREHSWQRDGGKLTGTKRLLVGIVLPDTFALVIYTVYQVQKG
ncbi:hypothetical protein [Longimicrobium sp.]|uniref:hypothetical protein n=1 Tax=Longimicrobium sp. TaxID=2029185 RepID=UPI002ED9EBCA